MKRVSDQPTLARFIRRICVLSVLSLMSLSPASAETGTFEALGVCPELDRLWQLDAPKPRTYHHHFQSVPGILERCALKPLSDHERMMLAIDAYLVAIMAKNDIVMSHGTVARPLPQNEADGDRILDIARSLVSGIDPSQLGPRPYYMGRLAHLFSGMRTNDGEDVAFVEPTEPSFPYIQFFEKFGPDEMRIMIIKDFGPVFWPDQFPAKD